MRELLDWSRRELLRRRAELVAAGADDASLIAIVLDGSASPDSWPMSVVCADEAEARGCLAWVDPNLPGVIFGAAPAPPPVPPFAVLIARDAAGDLLAQVGEFT